MIEQWKPVNGFETSYMISTNGNVKSLARERKVSSNGATVKTKEMILHVSIKCNGYPIVTLSAFGNKRKAYNHRLVAENFLPNPINLPTVNHKDGNKQNNNIYNLEWCSYAENNLHAYKTKLKIPFLRFGEKNPRSKLNLQQVKEIKSLLLKGLSQTEISKTYFVTTGCINSIKRNLSWAWVQ